MATLYVDMMSQPSRACVIFCRLNNIKVEEKLVNIAKGGTRSPEHRAVNPLGKLPCLQEGTFVLPESASILRYLATKADVPDHWYPREPKARARVDSALDWYHGNVRLHAAGLSWHRVIGKNLKQPVSEGQAKQHVAGMKTTFQTLEQFWLAKSPFLAGNEISIADLLHCCELDQLCLLDGAEQGPTLQELLEPFPRVQRWMLLVAQSTGPYWKTVSAFLHKVAQRGKERKVTASQSKL
ncbi:TPA: Glutathione S-transferase theta-1 [Trebouxia sp. C0004]